MLTPISSSFRDPSGFVFSHEKIIYRQINASYQENYEALMSSHLYESLVKEHHLLSHKEVRLPEIKLSNTAYKIIQPQPLDFVSYPYEWCFSQLKDAALLTLHIQKVAMEHQLTLKDASAYNIQFLQGRPIFIDTLSFEKYNPSKPWIAYKQFCEHFLAPLALMHFVDIHLGQLARHYIDGIPLTLASRLLPKRTHLNFTLLTHIHMHAQMMTKKEVKTSSLKNTQTALLALLDNLQTYITKLTPLNTKTEWDNYYQHTNYTSNSFEAKKTTVQTYLEQIKPTHIWDLGGNTGAFSRLINHPDVQILCMDADLNAVEINYHLVKQKKETQLLPLYMDLTNPSTALGWHHQERHSLIERSQENTALLALALIHHLVLSNHIPFEKIADFFCELGAYLIIEFIPAHDSLVQKLLSHRENIYPQYTEDYFEESFKKNFEILTKTRLPESERTLYLMKALHI